MSGHADGYADNQQETIRYCAPADKVIAVILLPSARPQLAAAS